MATGMGAGLAASRLVMGALGEPVGFFQVENRRAGDRFAVRIEAAAVAGAVPGVFDRVPLDDAAEVGAGCGAFVDLALVVAVDGEFVQAGADDGAVAGGDVIDA